MTRPSLFWLEADEMSGLLARLASRPTDEPRRPPTAAAAPLAPAPEVPPAPEPILTGALEDRLEALLEWLHGPVAIEHGFVVDEDGLAVVSQKGAPLELVAASSTLGETWESLRQRFQLATDNRLAVELDGGLHLHLMTTDTDWGRLSLGLVLRETAAPDTLATIHDQFRQTLDQGDAHP